MDSKMLIQWNFTFMILQACTHFCVHCLITYITPANNDSFGNFTITNLDPDYCPDGAPRKRDLLTIEERNYITFNFKGNGNAQILFQESYDGVDFDVFTVVIGDGLSNDKVTIYGSNLTDVLGQVTVDNITSETEFRSFWIRWPQYTYEIGSSKVAVGLCTNPYQNQVLSAEVRYFGYGYCIRISLSTSSGNSGEWQFASDGELLGGCNEYWDCHEGVCVNSWMDVSYYLMQELYYLIGTCVPETLQVSSAAIGDGDIHCQTGIMTQTTAIRSTAERAKKDNYREFTVETIAVIVGGSLGGMTVVLLIGCIFYMSCIHVSLTRMRRKIDQDFGRRDASNSLT